MAPHSAASEQVVRYCVGGESYRRQHRDPFLAAVAQLPVEVLLALLRNAHQSGMFASIAVAPQHQTPDVQVARDALVPFVVARTRFDTQLLAELCYVAERCHARAPRSQLVPLKGVSYWSRYYDNTLERQVRDLDVLVTDCKDMSVVCRVLEDEGYEALRFVGDDRSPHELIDAGETPSLPPFRIRRTVDQTADDEPVSAGVVTDYGEHLRLASVDGVGVVITVDVELHTHLFTSLTGKRIAVEPRHCQPSPVLEHVWELTPGTALAYTAAKLVLESLDACASGANSLKSCKLAADFVRILERGGQPALDQAILVARDWDTLHLLLDAVQSTRVFLPDVTFHGFPPPDEDNPFDSLLRDAVARPIHSAESVAGPAK